MQSINKSIQEKIDKGIYKEKRNIKIKHEYGETKKGMYINVHF